MCQRSIRRCLWWRVQLSSRPLQRWQDMAMPLMIQNKRWKRNLKRTVPGNKNALFRWRKQVRQSCFHFLQNVHKPVNIYPSTPNGKSSKKSQKIFLGSENQPPPCRKVTFTLLKLLRNPAKVTPEEGKSYSKTSPKFNCFTTFVFYSSVEISKFLTL